MARKTSISAEQAQQILERFRNGATSLAEERQRLNIRHNSSLRRALIKLLDGNGAAYRALILAQKKPRTA
jgi:hypothetical protein